MGVTISTESLLPLAAVYCCCHLVVLFVTASNLWLLQNHRIASIALMNRYVDYKLQILLQELVTIDDRMTGNGGCYKQKKRLELNCILTIRGTTRASCDSNFCFHVSLVWMIVNRYVCLWCRVGCPLCGGGLAGKLVSLKHTRQNHL
jgi:hypothetical protein